MDIYHILHLQAKKCLSSFIIQEDAASFLWFGKLFPKFSIFWTSTAFPLRHRTKNLYTLLWIKQHNMQQLHNAFWFVYFVPDFCQYSIFFYQSWLLNWQTELSETQLSDALTLLWAGGLHYKFSRCLFHFKNSVSWDSSLGAGKWKISVLSLCKTLESLLSVPELCTASATPTGEKWTQTGSSTENHY